MIKSQYKLYVLLALLTSFSIQAEQTDNIIVVQGVGEVTIDNTEGRISASVSTLDADADVALTNNSNIVSNIINELNSVGIEANDITTSQFKFYPEYDWADGSQNFIGYAVTNGLTIKVKDVSTLGAVLNLMIDAGISRINSVGFGTASLSTVKRQALEKATDDALVKAQILANSTGVTLGKVIQIKLASNSTLLDQSGGLSSAPPISPGSNTYVETVNVTFQLLD